MYFAIQKITSAMSTPQSCPLQYKQFPFTFEEEIDHYQKKPQDSCFSNEKKTFNTKKYNFNPFIWTLQDEKKLIQLHKQVGNKWTILSKHFEGSSQNFIKNHFYSRLRKSIRKLNKNISILFEKQYNKFNLNIIFKLSNISQGKVIGKCNIETEITTFYKDFIYRLMEFSQNEEENDRIDRDRILDQVQSFTLSLIALQNIFRIISGERVYKGKKKNIAYLKRFNFKLESQSDRSLVISKQNCYISDYPTQSQIPFLKSSESANSQDMIVEQCQNGTPSKIPANSNGQIQKTEWRTCCASFIQPKNLYKQTMQHTDDSHIQSNIQNPTILDQELIQFQLPIQLEKEYFCQNLLDQYGGTKFNFDLQY